MRQSVTNLYPRRTPLGERLLKSGSWSVYLIPALAIYVIFMALPLFNSMILSLFTGSGYTLDKFVGLDNYAKLFTVPRISERFFGAFLHTGVFFAIHMVVQNVLGLIFAVFLVSKGLKGSKIFQTIIFIPATMAVLVTGYLWKLILNPQWGALPIILKALGAEPLPWLGNETWALPVISLVSSWQWVGMPTMMFIAGLNRISDDILEAAEIDGANRWQVFWRIRLPLLLPVIAIISVLTFIDNFNAFDVVFAMENANGAPNYATDIMGTFFYREGIAGQHPGGIPDAGLGAAVATIVFFFLLIGVMIILRLTRGNSQDAKYAQKGARNR